MTNYKKYIFLLALVTPAMVVGLLKVWGETPVTTPSQIVEVGKGHGLSSIGRQLTDRGIVSNHLLWRLYTRLLSDSSHIQRGRYLFDGEMSPSAVIRKLVDGDTYHEQVLALVVPEGFTVRDIAETLIKLETQVEPEEFKKLCQNRQFLAELGITAQSAEGYLYPATYRFYDEMPAAETIIRRMVNEFFNRIGPDYPALVAAKGLSLHEAVIFASLIEREAAVAEEKFQIAEVIWNRLEKNIALAIDASIIYGIKDYKGNLSRRHLVDKKNPYNTRVHRGLPPGPIGSPDLKSLQAILTPTSHGYFYYVLDPMTFRTHKFSATLKEHNSHVQNLVRAQKSR